MKTGRDSVGGGKLNRIKKRNEKSSSYLATNGVQSCNINPLL